MKVKVKLSSVIFTIVSVCILILTPVITSHADLYESWMRTGENEVYTQSNPSAGTPPENTEEQDSLIKHVTKFMWYAGEDFSSKYYKNDYFAFSLDGVVNGRLSGYDISIGKFELYENNPYGIIGAYGYIVLRNLVYGLMFLYFLILLIRYMATSGSTQRNELRDIGSTIIFLFLLLYLMPIIINLVTVVRDGTIRAIGTKIGFSQFVDFDLYLAQARASNKNVLFCVALRLAYTFGGLFYASTYIGIALRQTGFFIIFPIVALFSVRNKKLLSAWCSTFFANLMVPALDYVFLLIPQIVRQALPTKLDVTESFSYMFLLVLCVWGAQAARTVLLALWSNIAGAQSMGIGRGLMSAGLIAARAFSGSGKGSGSNGSMEGVSDRTNANRLETMAENYNSSLADRQREIGAIDSYMSARDSDISKLSDDNGISIFTVGDEEQTAMFKDAENGLLQGDANQDVLSSQEGSLDESVSVPEGVLSENELVDGETAFSNLSDLHDDNLYAVQEEHTEESVSDNSPINIEEKNNKEEGVPNSETTLVSDGSAMSNAISDDLAPIPNPVEGTPSSGNTQREQFERLRAENLTKMEEYQGKMDTATRDIDAAKEEVTVAETKVSELKQADTHDANNISSNKAKIAELSQQRESLKTEISGHQYEVERLLGNRSVESLSVVERVSHDKLQSAITEKTALREQLGTKINTLKSENVSLNEQMTSRAEKIADANKALTQAKQKQTIAEARYSQYKVGYDRRMQAESNMAHMQELYGGSGKIYKSSSQYADTRRYNEIVKRQTNYRNFDSRAAADILSPEEKAAYARKRANVNTAKNVVSKVAGAAVGFVGASAGMMGGPSTTAIGAAGGYMLAENVAQKAVGAAEQGIELEKSVAEKNAVKEKSVSNRKFTNTAKKPVKTTPTVSKPQSEVVSTTTPQNQWEIIKEQINNSASVTEKEMDMQE